MATGDNIMTAIAVSKESKLIESETKVYLCSLNNIMNRQTLQWEALTDIHLNKEEEFMLAELNKTIYDISYGDPTRIKHKNTSSQASSISELNFAEPNDMKRSMNKMKKSFIYSDNYEEIQKFYKYLEIVKEEDEDTATINHNIINNEINKEHKNENKENSFDDISNDLNIDDLPFDNQDLNQNEYVLAVQGKTFERLYKLNNQYKKTLDVS